MTQAANNLVQQHTKQGITTVTLSQPDKRNSLSMVMLDALSEVFTAMENDADTRVVVLAAAGRVFCAGHDLREMRSQFDCQEFQLALFQRCSKVMQQIVNLPKPVIARVAGVATAAGCQLVASCDLAVAEEGARFATPGVNIGLFCSTPMVALSRNVSRKHAMEMLLTGEMIDAARAESIGLVNRVVAAEHLDETVYQMAATIAGKSGHALKVGKTAFYRQLEMPLADAYDYTAEVMAGNVASVDAQEGICAFLEKRDPEWQDK
ncbi:MAG: Enoyl-CoA hydratase/carnithine racemase [Marinobacter excellens HL-55]|uniref:Enoyl-CoA hydratase domain-containing protein 3, mitochondrial n=1 Tax=Marinobacter excellens HL-55 TaxID=1305731 RepID=A0A0P8BP17_9GAMM|nr:MAG: Enoyl-CoA hydratase/carnithine racemase [Marinobacter excellens HL-55]